MLHLHTAEELRVLADHLGEVLADAPADPMQREWVAVPSGGMRVWLSLRLAQRLGASAPARSDGVTANIEFPFPGSLRARILDADRGEGVPDPWAVERLVWTVLEVADADARWIPAPITAPAAGASRYAAARRVADLFDRYHLHRPAMISAWGEQHDVDGAGAPLADHQRWQPRLWRALRDRIGDDGPPRRMQALLAELRHGQLEVDLPERLSVFGMSLLPGGPGFLDLADAVAAHREVHLFVVSPSPAMVARFRSATAAGGREATTENPSGHRLRKEVDATRSLRHPLNRSWGRLHYETASVLSDAVERGIAPSSADLGSAGSMHSVIRGDPTAPAGSLLGRLQADVRADRTPVADLVPDPHDDSLQFHACHGRTRQVEVLRDTILGLLERHDDLHEDEVLVVCPDLERFAPVIHATLGPSARTGAEPDPEAEVPRLRYRLADRSLGASAPLVGAFGDLLELVVGRFDAPSVLDFIALEPVRTRFGFDDDALATITGWVLDVRIRWGLDADRRAGLGVPAEIRTNTWQAGIDRILLGAATRGGRLDDAVAGVVPHGTEGSDVALAGRLADLLWRLGELAAETSTDRTIGEWLVLLQQAATGLLALPRGEAWQLDRLVRTLSETAATAVDPSGASSSALLAFADARKIVEERVGDVEGRPTFFRGGVTFSSLTPLRWVPHRVIGMLGMDAGALGVGIAEGDDLAALIPLVGDRDRRSELRQSMLETVLSAGSHLVVVRDGSDVRTNQPVPMPVALAELRDAVTASVAAGHRQAFADTLEIAHPRQPFDERCFGAVGEPDDQPIPLSFDETSRRAALGRRRRDDVRPAFLAAPLPPPPAERIDTVTIDLSDLHRFLRSPIRCFLERRLELRLPRSVDAPSPILEVKLGGLDQHAAGGRLLQLLLAGEHPEVAVRRWREHEMRTGTAPAGVLGTTALDKLAEEVLGLHHSALSLGLPGPRADPVAVDVVLGDGTRLRGTVPLAVGPAVEDARGGAGRLQFARRRPHQVLSVWVELAALTLARPGESWRAVVATRSERSGKADPELTCHELQPDDPVAAARHAIEVVIDLYRRGLAEPLPLFATESQELHLGRKIGQWPARYPDDAELLVFGELTASELMELDLRPHDPPGEGADRARRYAHHLFGAVDRTLVATRPAGAAR